MLDPKADTKTGERFKGINRFAHAQAGGAAGGVARAHGPGR